LTPAHGSVFGLLLFTLYTHERADLLARDSVLFHAFVDDNQLYLPRSTKEAEHCIETIDIWMSANA